MSYVPNLRVAMAVLVGFAIPFASNAQIEEIVVTSTKRAKTLQEIPIAVSVTTAETIEKAEIKDIYDLQSVVPSLRVNTLQSSANTNFTIRGFGNGANNPGIEPSVGIFIDGVYRSRSASSISDLPNVERVEVLRGPQSTLFGKNASAGVISVVTQKPTGESAARLSATIGNYSQLIVRGQAEGAIGDNSAWSIAASSNTRDGYFRNELTGTDLNDRDRQAIRGQLLFNPTDETEIRIIADYDQIDEKCCGVNNFVTSPLESFTNAVTGARINEADQFINSAFYNIDPRNEVENSGVSIQVDRDYSNFTLTSISSFRTSELDSIIDADFTAADYIRNPINVEIDTFTQEFRLTSNGDGNVDWMVGGYFFDETVDYNTGLDYGAGFRPLTDALTTAVGAPNALAGIEAGLGLPVGRAFFPANGSVAEVASLDNQAVSIFGQLDWHISDQLTATLGLNYTQDDKDTVITQTERDLFSGLDLDQIGTGLIASQLIQAGVPPSVAFAQAAGAVAAGLNPIGGLTALQFLPPFQNTPNAVEDGVTDDSELTYTLRLAYDVNGIVSVYGGIATGFKASSINLSRDSRPSPAAFASLQAAGLLENNVNAGTRFASPEEATAIELGLKARFDQASLNVAIFEQEIDGFQSNAFTGTGFNLVNAGKQSTKGIEFDLAYYPNEAWKLTFAGTLLDAKYDEFVGSVAGDISGQDVSGVSETSLSLGAEYNFTLGNMPAYIRGDFQYDSDVQTNEGISEDISSYSIENLNLTAGIVTENGLSFSIWGRNVTDHETASTAFPTVAGTGGIFGYHIQPATYGVTISKDF